MDACTKGLANDYPLVQLIGISSIVGTILSGGLILQRYGWRGFITPNWKLFVLRGALVTIISWLIVTALSQITLADFYGIIFMMPFLTTLLSTLILKEKIGLHRIIAMGVGFIGVIILAGPRLDSEPIGLMCAFIAMIMSSFVTIIIRKIGREPVTTLFAFAPFAANALIYGPLMFLPGNFVMPTASLDILAFSLLGFLGFGGFILYSIGFTRATATAIIAPFHYSQMIWGVLLGYILFKDIPTLTTIAGSIIIFSAGLYLLWREYVHHLSTHSISATLTPSGTMMPAAELTTELPDDPHQKT